MRAAGFRKRAENLILLGVVLFIGPSLSAGERAAPVFKRTASGHLVQRGTLDAPKGADRAHSRIFHFDRPSRRNILKEPVPALHTAQFALSGTDTVRVLLIRVSFMTDRLPALSSITTGGDFDLSPDNGAIIDPTPHDKAYFDSHMRGLRNYFYYQSCGALEVEWHILPEGPDESYKLSDIADYGPGTTEVWTVDRLVRFFTEAIEAADEALASEGYPVRFGDFDAVVLAHAGANLQTDIDYDTPNDIPSFFARLGDDDVFTVDGGETLIEDGSVVPEYSTQDGYYSGIAGVLFHEFGHQLGLPDLYNTESGFPAVGIWDLMDSGGMVGQYIEDGQGVARFVEGFLPAGLSLWSKIYLGWASVDTILTFDGDLSLPAVEKCPARGVRVEASSDEYFLVENRAAELDETPTILISDDTGVIIGVANCYNCQSGMPEVPDYELINGYDLLLPLEADTATYTSGPGLIVWHIDEGLIEQRWEENLVNSISPFGVSVVEASGIVDLGDPYALFWLGWYDDAFYEGNNATLSDSTLPPSWSNWRAQTGVRIEGISGRDTLMTFGAGVRELEAAKLAPPYGSVPNGAILPLGGPADALIVDRFGDLWRAGHREAPLATIDAAPVTPIAFSESFGDLGPVVVIGGEDGTVHLVRTADWSEPEGWPFSVFASLKSHPVIMDTEAGDYVTLTDAIGRLRIIASDGTEPEGVSPIFLSEGERFIANVVVGTDTAGTARRIYTLSGRDVPPAHAWLAGWDVEAVSEDSLSLSSAGEYIQRLDLTADEISGRIFMVAGDIVPSEPDDEIYIACEKSGRIMLIGARGRLSVRDREERVVHAPALIDLNGDALLDLLYSDGYSVYAIAPSGANLLGWPKRLEALHPVAWQVRSAGAITGAVSEGGGLVLVGTEHGLFYALDGSGRIYPGFPRKISRALPSSIELLPHEQGALTLYGDGDYVKWRIVRSRAKIDGNAWVTECGDHSRGAYARPSDGWTQREDQWLGLSQTLIVYPNPSSGERVGFHFSAPEEGTALLEVMTLTGELVSRVSKRVEGGDDEFVISMSDKAPGIYLCRLVIESGGRSVEASKKFAIVR